MLTLCRASKGGAGATTVTALSALAHAERSLLVDLEGELGPALGIAPSDRPGVLGWLSSSAPLEHLDDLLLDVDDTTALLPARGRRPDDPAAPEPSIARWMQLASWCRSWAVRAAGTVFIDAGVVGASTPPDAFAGACDRRWLVTRRCYLGLRRVGSYTLDHTGVVVIDEPGRSLSSADVAAAVGAPVEVVIPWDHAIARAVDAGICSSRPRRSTMRALQRATSNTVGDEHDRRTVA